MRTWGSLGAHSCPHCECFVLDFRSCANEEQLRLFRSIEWVYKSGNAKQTDQRHKQWPQIDPGFSRWDDARLAEELAQNGMRGGIWIMGESVEDCEHHAKDGCKLYTMLLDAINRGISPDRKATLWEAHYEPKDFVLCFQNYQLYGGVEKISFGSLLFRQEIISMRYKSEDSEEDSDFRLYQLHFDSVLHLELGSDEDSSVRTKFETRAANIRPGSKESLDDFASWFRVCMQEHQSCDTLLTGINPCFVLEISNPGPSMSLRLVRLPTGARYAALSYCWGGAQLITTTKNTVANHCSRISFPDVPRTLKDAALVTVNLGLMYLWVDALCIIQDDDHFKASEIERMADIYSNAAVTIIASCAQGVNDGFLHARSDVADHLRDKIHKVQYTNSKLPSSGPVYLFPNFPNIRKAEEPLECRAWALQERLLSKRILEFGTNQTRWFCSENATSGKALFTDGWRQNDYSISIAKIIGAVGKTASPAPPARTVVAWNLPRSYITSNPVYSPGERLISMNPSRNHTLAKEWHDLVTVYSKRSLTHTKDKLPAIAGIAAHYGLATGDEYLAGLWKSMLISELCWRCLDDQHERPLAFQAPSWSWASINGQISFESHGYSDAPFVVESYYVSQSMEDSKYGEVQSGILRINGHVTTGNWVFGYWYKGKQKIDPPDPEKPGKYKSSYMGALGSADLTFWPDALEPEFVVDRKSSLEVFVILIGGKFTEEQDYWSGIWGLVLRRLPNGQFSRLGLFQKPCWIRNREFAWITEAEIRTVEII